MSVGVIKAKDGGTDAGPADPWSDKAGGPYTFEKLPEDDHPPF